jgi:hypothetical protein
MKAMRITVRVGVLAGFLLAISALVAPATARAASGAATIVKFNGPSAFATFDSTSGDIETFVIVVGTQPAGASPQVTVIINQFDLNTGTTLLSASGSTSTATFQLGPNLSSATTSATVPLTDTVSGDSFNVEVNVAWTASSPLMHQNNTTVTHTPSVTMVFHSTALLRNADASGTVSDGTTNFTPSSSVAVTQILRVNSAQIAVTHP